MRRSRQNLGASRPGRGVDADYGRDCVGAEPSPLLAARIETPWGTSVLVLRDPNPEGLLRLVDRDGYGGVRFWLSPCGDHAIAWTAGDVAHFQLYCGLIERGWHQGRVELGAGDGPVFTVQEPNVDLLVAGAAAARMAPAGFTAVGGTRRVRVEAARDAGPAS